LWDYDTLKQERARFPDTLELITGKFLRHSPEFYEWRIKDRQQKLKTDPKNPSLYDDLAVAYAKTGQYAKAIATMEALERIAPGRYETYSNLGTFHFLAGDIAKALPLIDTALAINPDAHFGREKYQRWLGDYLLVGDKKKGGKDGFARFLEGQIGRELKQEDVSEAVKAVLGMMRFANHENPVLLSALADLLKLDEYGSTREIDAKRLAVRAILKEGYSVKDRTFSPEAIQRAKDVLLFHYRHGRTTEELTVEEVASRFKEELADAETWYAELRTKEIGWINSGMNPEVEFDKLYTEAPQLPDEPTDAYPRTWTQRHRDQILVWIAISGAAMIGVAVIFVVWRLCRRPA
jgi:tetratricopeptide (TPR) repeat protein